MGDRSVVADEPQATAGATGPVRCDHVVFTSVRGPTGEGYRIIGASPGARAEERAEITRRSPSHGSLCPTGPEQVGLLSYVLSSGRRCVAYICHAGIEHTARGGQRVYTHAALFDREAYRRFDCDPVTAHAALGRVVKRDGPLLKAVPSLEPIELSPNSGNGWGPTLIASSASIPAEWFWAVSQSMLEGRPLVLAGSAVSLRLLQWALLAVPRAIRERVEVSVGVSYSPSRPVPIVLLPAADALLEQRLSGQPTRLLRMEQAPPTVAPSWRAWFDLIGRWLRQGRVSDIVQLTSKTCADAPPAALARVANICMDLDAAREANIDELEAMVSRYQSVAASHPCEQILMARLLNLARQRIEELAAKNSESPA